MKNKYRLLKALVLGCFVTFSMAASFAGYPPPYYNQAPNYDQQQDYNDNQQRIYNMEAPEYERMAPGGPPPSQQEIIMQAPSPMHV